ncbi:hypothetical protein ILUMI_09677 [Ignelater luminosus]|uniref:DUF243 domain-containing protein n=1 Tax=Ignelater luminosus TaxID=2038154 RepID=A0A8K0D5C4_IGNLU|nr:hypothetical protein ILUMI_09677 [Ignelater luminosus]
MKQLMFILPFVIGVISYPDVSELSGYNYNQPSTRYLPADNSGKQTQPTGSYIPPSSGSNGYNYNKPGSTNQPSTNYLPARTSENLAHQPSGSYIPPTTASNNGYNYNPPARQPSTSYIPAGNSVQPTRSYIPPSTGSNGYNHNAQVAPSTNYLPARNSHNIQPSGSYIPPTGNQPSGSYIPPSSANHQPSGSYLPSDQHSANLVENQDQKHVYYFAAPDEEEQARFRINIAPSTQKNTRIIFVKTPSYGNIVPEVISPPSQAEDKTLVYVLVKKPQQDNSITIPASTGVKPAKPEVYFIKYKNQHEAESAVSESLNGRSAGSTLPDLGNEQEFIKSLKDSLQKSGNLEDFSGSSSSQLGSGGYEDSSNLLNGGSLNNNYGPPGGSGPY